MCEMPEEPLERLQPPAPRTRRGSVSVLPTTRREPASAPAPPFGASYGPGATAAPSAPAQPVFASSAHAPSGAGAGDGFAGEPADVPGDAGGAGRETATGLPKREPASLRGGKSRSGAGLGAGAGLRPPDDDAADRSADEQSAARFAFADDLTAFSLGSKGAAGHEAQDPHGKGTPT
jgi:hypothetical protein